MPFELPFRTVEGMAAFLLVFMRLTGMTISAPLFSNRSFPMQLRVWLSFWMALVMFPVIWQSTPEGTYAMMFRQPASAVLAVAVEIAIGWALGWTASLIIWGIQLAGFIIDQEIGLTLGAIFDPISQSSASPLAQFFFTLGLLAFVTFDGHHQLVMALARSFQVVPPGAFPFNQESATFLVQDMGSQLWRIGVQIAFPSMLALLLVTTAMALLARAVPEMNIFFVGFAVRIAVGLLTVVVVMPLIPEVFGFLIDMMQESLVYLLELWRTG